FLKNYSCNVPELRRLGIRAVLRRLRRLRRLRLRRLPEMLALRLQLDVALPQGENPQEIHRTEEALLDAEPHPAPPVRPMSAMLGEAAQRLLQVRHLPEIPALRPLPVRQLRQVPQAQGNARALQL
ncbi:unnamed protein product, partial [Nesidiocoris tenuis]